MGELPKTTEEKIAFIAQGFQNSEEALDPERISLLLNATFDSHDYPTALHACPNAQQYIDGLFEVHDPYSVKSLFTQPLDFLQNPP